MNYMFMRFPGFKSRALTLSYDDGAIYDKRLIDIMNKNGLKGTFNINSGFLIDNAERELTNEQTVRLYLESGNEVAVHGKKHLYLTELPSAMAVDEILNDRIALEEMFGTIVSGMAYAYGSYNDRIVGILKDCGIEYARTVVSTERFDIPNDWLRLPATCHHENPRLMELARSFVEDELVAKRPKLFYLWGHSFEFNRNNNWNVIEEFAEYIGNRSDIWYATNIEVCKYVKAYDALCFSANGNIIYNPTATDIYLNYFDKEILVKAGETVKTNLL